jgi:hypothetical protein
MSIQFRSTRSALAAGLALALATVACSGGSLRSGAAVTSTRSAEGRVFTADAIRASGALTAWQALERLASSMQPRSDGAGEPGSFGRTRPAMRYNSPQSTLVVLNGFRIPDLRVLSSIPAHEIASMQVLSMTRAQALYGRDGWNGAIVIETFDPKE